MSANAVKTLLGCISVALLVFPGGARAGDEGYRFDPSTGSCRNSAHEQGLNPDYVGQCGDLRNAYLFQADLHGMDLRGANLHKAHLSGANLRGVDLRGAKLSGAYLYKADMREADLRGATFNMSLRGADLYKVKLEGAKIDIATELPFSRPDALRSGMVLLDAGDDSSKGVAVQSARPDPRTQP